MPENAHRRRTPGHVSVVHGLFQAVAGRVVGNPQSHEGGQHLVADGFFGGQGNEIEEHGDRTGRLAVFDQPDRCCQNVGRQPFLDHLDAGDGAALRFQVPLFLRHAQGSQGGTAERDQIGSRFLADTEIAVA